jgi:FAD/FMN-containing dehydrogenase
MELNSAEGAALDRIRAALPDDMLRPLTPGYLEEPRGLYQGRGGALALPRSVEEVSALLRAAQAERIGIVPYGGGTGLVGGQVKGSGPIPVILSLERMAAVRAVHPEENVLIAEAGVILADVQQAARAAGRLFPLSLASEGSARIGGNLATNAGGVNVLRYGNTRDLCLGIEAVMADGSVLNGLTRLRKDNTGYDIRNLLIGSEGTLGIITAAALKLAPIPARRGVAFLAVRDPEAALELLTLARGRVGEGISAFELIHRCGFDFLAEKLPDIRLPWSDPPDWSVLIELGLSAESDPQTALGDIFEAAMEAGLVSDGLVAQSEAQADGFWNVREHLPEGNRRIGSISSHDVSLPLGAVAEFIARAPERIAPLGTFRINCFGHFGDGNLHYNVFPPPGHDRSEYGNVRGEIQRRVHDLVHEVGGSISAEHGIGRAKTEDLQRYGDPVKLALMRAIKQALDPVGILNPGAVLPA